MDMSGRAVETKGRLDRGRAVLKRHPKNGKEKDVKGKEEGMSVTMNETTIRHTQYNMFIKNI